jgi:hypothetical protein
MQIISFRKKTFAVDDYEKELFGMSIQALIEHQIADIQIVPNFKSGDRVTDAMGNVWIYERQHTKNPEFGWVQYGEQRAMIHLNELCLIGIKE